MKLYESYKELKYVYCIFIIFLLTNNNVICFEENISLNKNSLNRLLGNWRNNKSEISKFIGKINKNNQRNFQANRNRNKSTYNEQNNNNPNQESEEDSNIKPEDIVKLNNLSKQGGEDIDIDLKQNDPLKLMKMKEDVMSLYFNKAKSQRFKQVKLQGDPYDPKNNPQIPNPVSKDFLTTKPTNVGKNGDPVAKEYHNDEEVVKIIKAESTSIYKDYKRKGVEYYFPDRILSGGDKFWCSEGGHEFFEDIKFYITFDKSFRLNAIWIHWAFAPGEYKISFSNDETKTGTTVFDLITNGYQQSVKNADLNWWKSVLSNSKTRWKYKSFDQRIDFEEPIWARIIEISMRVPVNQYYGIYKLEVYTKSKEVVMIKSKKIGEDLCLTVVNGILSNFSPVVALDCLQALSYGDNRELFILNSNGYITTFRDEKCMESATANKVDILDCGVASQYKDEREKWIMEFDGKIRSTKEEFTCLSVADMSITDEIPTEDMKVSASSNQSDGLHDANRASSENVTNYWASDPSIGEVVFEIYFHKYSYIARDMTIYWKFPAKKFKITGLYPDGYWKVFKKGNNNRDDTTYINLMNKDLMGIKIIMMDSTTKIQDKNVYGIKNISIHTGSRYLRRDPCKEIILDANKFELISVGILDKVTGNEFKKSKSVLHQTRTKLKTVEFLYQKVPDSIIGMKEIATKISQKLNGLSNTFTDIKNRLKIFSEFLLNENVRIFTLAANEYFPAMDCANIIRSFPSKRSGMYWIKNECMRKALNVYCDFDSYEKNGGLDYFIYNDDMPINTPFPKKFKGYFDLRYSCNKLGMEPMEIKNDLMLNKLFHLLKIFNYDLESDTVIPIAYDYNCDVSKCAGLFKPLNDIESGDITDLIKSFIKDNGNNINYLFNAGMDGDSNSVLNIAAFGKLNNIIFDKLDAAKVSAIICSSNKDGKKAIKNFIDVECDGHLRTDTFSSYEIFSNIRMICPSDCAKEKAPVYGSGMYTDNSSVCRAAIHSGAIIDTEGGIVEVRIEPGKKNYLGSSRHNIETLDNPSSWDRSFSISKYDPYCPIDKMKNYSKAVELVDLSFIESSTEISLIDDKLENRTKNNFSNFLGNKKFLQMLIKSGALQDNKNSNSKEENFNSRNNNNEGSINFNFKELNDDSENINDKEIIDINKSLRELEIKKENKLKKILKNRKQKNLNNLDDNDSENEQANSNNNIENYLKNLINENSNNESYEDEKVEGNNTEDVLNFIKNKNKNRKLEDFNDQLVIEKNIGDKKSEEKSIKTTENNLINVLQNMIGNKKIKSQMSKNENKKENSELLNNINKFSRFIQTESESEKKVKSNSENEVGPELLNKIESLSPGTKSNNDPDVNNNYINSIASRIQAENETNKKPSREKMQKEVMRRLSQMAEDDSEKKKYKELLGFSTPSFSQTTEQALSYINASYTKEEKGLMQIKKVADDFKALIGKAISQISLLNTDKDFGIEPQHKNLLALTKKTTDINKIIFEIEKKIQNKLRRTEYKLLTSKYRIKEFLVRNEYTENFQDNIFSNYEIFNSKKGKGKPSKWEFYPYNIDGHAKVIKQENSFMDSRTGSHLFVKDKDYYDLELKASFFLKDNNSFGILFRYIDPYNYYIFEVSNQDKGFKRVRKFVKGIPKIIDFKNDGGFIQETWYNVKIRAQQSFIYIYMTDRTGDNMEKLYELQFKIIDNEIVHGSIAFASSGISFMLLDNITVNPLQCTNFDDTERDKQIPITPSCPRYFENFKNGFSERWKVVDPKDYIDGPSIWKVDSDFEYRELVLTQNSLVYGSSDNQEGTMYIMTDSKMECNVGKIAIKFKALDVGIVGIVFRFEKSIDGENNFYIFEISGDPNDKFIRVRKRMNGNWTLVSVNPLLRYKKNSWLRVSMTLNVDQFNAFISEDASPDNVIKVFSKSAKDTDFKYGNIGLSAYKTRLIVDEIIISPFDNLDEHDPDTTLYVDQESLDLPRSKLKDMTIFDRINSNIQNFTWGKCLRYPLNEDRTRFCRVLFTSQNDIDRCYGNFCNSCCNKYVDQTNPKHNYLCKKQCNSMETGTNAKNIKNCIEPNSPEHSLYPYCEENFQGDFHGKTRCKTDMCNLCCIGMETKTDKSIITDDALGSCYEKCLKNFNRKHDGFLKP